LIKYVQNQETHHKKETFSDELKGFLKQHNVDYDEKYPDYFLFNHFVVGYYFSSLTLHFM